MFRLLKLIPRPYCCIEAVRVGQDVRSFVRVTLVGIDLGIWKWVD